MLEDGFGTFSHSEEEIASFMAHRDADNEMQATDEVSRVNNGRWLQEVLKHD